MAQLINSYDLEQELLRGMILAMQDGEIGSISKGRFWKDYTDVDRVVELEEELTDWETIEIDTQSRQFLKEYEHEVRSHGSKLAEALEDIGSALYMEIVDDISFGDFADDEDMEEHARDLFLNLDYTDFYERGGRDVGRLEDMISDIMKNVLDTFI